jgi:Short C-terminal domain/Phospholipase_D-nuclease N-terminal
MIATTWGTGQVLLDILWFFLFFIEVWLMITIFIDLFRRHDMKGWLKAFWVFLIIVVPLVGILLYLIFYGDEMRVHALQAQAGYERAFRAPPRDGGQYSPASELMHLSELRERGVITDDEFERIKSRIVNG